MKEVSLVTGGAGFIGSHLVDLLISYGHEVIVVDNLTYAGDIDNLNNAAENSKLIFVEDDICNGQVIYDLLKEHKVKTIYHLAAESHVDNSINNSFPFIQTNVVGTYTMLDAALKYWGENDKFPEFRFIHVSTDEVYGHLGESDPAFHETTPYAPNSPYSASKAGSDHLARAWHMTFGLPVIITNCSNNYGSRQHFEKLIPTIVRNALAGNDIPIYGNGKNIRDWLYVKDHCMGLYLAAQKGNIGSSYCFGGGNEKRNIDLAEEICGILDEAHPRDDKKSYADQITFVEDRKGHDWRYAINYSKAKSELGYEPQNIGDSYLVDTVDYYIKKEESIGGVSIGNSVDDLSAVKKIDLATTPLNYEKFRQLAKNPNLTAEERIGFPDSYRKGYEDVIIDDITDKLGGLNIKGGYLLDIGCGASPLTDALLKKFKESKLNVVLNDSDEMLDHIKNNNGIAKVPGLFPECFDNVMQHSPKGYDYILCYSVLHYIYVDSNIFDFTDSVMKCLKPGGIALIGDIPNISKRKRFFSSETGVKYHQEFMKTLERPKVEFLKIEQDQIDDSVLYAMVQRAQLAGYDAYIAPQGKRLPMQNRRDDLLIMRP
ncbi:MAG: dTDP-glucose 4,6-dehydratase [Gammaproteobacteria bacterium]|nr:dTDP-glucose 4,6-dehydratase [Gammaproteobacteria bacterium]